LLRQGKGFAPADGGFFDRGLGANGTPAPDTAKLRTEFCRTRVYRPVTFPADGRTIYGRFTLPPPRGSNSAAQNAQIKKAAAGA
jgi:hypothetical protein